MILSNGRIPGVLAGLAAIALPSLAAAAALERAVPAVVRILYEDGTYGELGVVYTDPDLEGKGAQLPPSLGGAFVRGNTGNLLGSDWKFSGALKGDFNERLSYVILFDQPFVANTSYGLGSFPAGTFPPNFNYKGTDADLDTYQFSGGLAYDATDNVKIYGGLRAQRLDANAAIPVLSGYSIDAEDDWGWGGFVGAAYARPELGLRVALTYATKITYSLDTTEKATVLTPLGPQKVTVDDTTDVDTPQSATLEAQTGINEKTLIFGSVRWVDWSEFAIAPQLYGQVTKGLLGEKRPLVDYPKDWWTFNAGVARSFTEALAGTLSVTYEPQVDEVLTTLGPVDGRTTINAGASYDVGQVNISGGVSYGWLGDTTNLLDTKYRDGTIFAAGLRVGYSF
jgi:long-subunit fatty acid transport protein